MVQRPRLPLPWPVLVALAVLAVAGIGVALIALGVFGKESSSGPVGGSFTTPGIPISATKNTSRVSGSDPTADAAGVALATYPSSGTSRAPSAVTLVGQSDWQGGIAAAALVGSPIDSPILISSPGGLPAVTSQAIAALAPKGGSATRGSAVLAVGAVAVPGGLRSRRIGGRDPATEAAQIERLQAELLGHGPDHIVVASQEDAAMAMPAAGWAARSGDPVLFSARNALPPATLATLKRNRGVPVYVLGPDAVISSSVVQQISRVSPHVRRVFGSDPVTNAISFARYSDQGFGWNINDPGHGFVIARSDRPLDAAAAAPLSAAGNWGPLLVTDSASALPGSLRGYLLDLKPGYRTDPTRAIYNHVWLIGDQHAIDSTVQASIDQLAELAKVRSPAGGT